MPQWRLQTYVPEWSVFTVEYLFLPKKRADGKVLSKERRKKMPPGKLMPENEAAHFGNILVTPQAKRENRSCGFGLPIDFARQIPTGFDRTFARESRYTPAAWQLSATNEFLIEPYCYCLRRLSAPSNSYRVSTSRKHHERAENCIPRSDPRSERGRSRRIPRRTRWQAVFLF